MRRLPDQVDALLKKLWTKPSLWQRLAGAEEPWARVIEELAACGRIEVVPHVAPFVFESGAIGGSAMKAITRLVSLATGADLVGLDEAVRSDDWWWDWAGWRRIKPANVRRLEVPAEFAAAVYGVLSFHPNGHVREAAVRELEKVRDGSEVPYLLIRLNDWVTQIHEASRATLMERLRQQRFGDFFAWLDLVFWLSGCGRYDHRGLVQPVVKALVSAEGIDALCDALQSRSRLIRRSAYRAAIAAGVPELQRFLVQVLRSEDPVLRLWATRDAKKLLRDADLRHLAPELLQDNFVPVRREALVCVMERFPEGASAALTNALMDTAASMREFARFYLRRISELDSAAFYRGRLDERNELAVAIAGIGETGSVDDVPRLVGFLANKRARIRAAAARAIGKLSKVVPREILRAIGDDHKKVTLEACRATARNVDSVSLEELVSIFRAETRTHARMAVVQLIDLKETWDALPDLVEACGLDDREVATAARRRVVTKFNRVFTKPTSEQRAAILKALETLKSPDSVAFVEEVNSWLRLRS
jgi:HEAT repeat protein